MIALLLSYFKFFMLAALWLAALVIFLGYSTYLVGYGKSLRSRQVLIDSVVLSGTDNVTPQAVARAKEIGIRIPFEQLYEVNVPRLTDNFGAREALKLPDDAKITIQGVELSALARTFLSLLPATQYTVTIRPGAEEDTLELEWQPPGDLKRYWLLRLDPQRDDVKEGGARSQVKIKKVLLDRAIYSLLYFMYYDADGPLEWKKDAALKERFPDARALEAYYVGRQKLASYLHTLDAAELDKAESEFRLLQEQMPRFVDGLMLLGITLSERRNEREAIGVYERVEREIEQPPPVNDYAKWKTLFQARLFKATANRKLYRWQNLHVAIAQLDELIADLVTKINTNMLEMDRAEFRKIYVAALAEKAASIPYYLVLLYRDNFVHALTGQEVPGTLRLDDAQEAALLHIEADKGANRAAHIAAFRKQMRRLYKAHAKAREVAQAALGAAIPGTGERDARDRARIMSILHSAQGYARYRYAQVQGETGSTEADKDAKYRRRCVEALQFLQDADALRPNDYVILQNMGLIYGDARFDPDGSYIETARRLFARSVKLKPDDYFGHQQLAGLAVREAYLWGLEFTDPTVIADGLKSANAARAKRPGEPRILVLLSQLHSLQAAAQLDGTDPNKEKQAAMIALAAAEQANANPVWILQAKLQAAFLEVRRSDSDDLFNKARTKLATIIHQAKNAADLDAGWEAHNLSRIARALERQDLDKLTHDNRLTLRWPK
jgi:hypothetical protein